MCDNVSGRAEGGESDLDRTVGGTLLDNAVRMSMSMSFSIAVISVCLEWVVALESQPLSSSITSYNNSS